MLRETAAEVFEWLHIAIRPVHILVAMIEIYVRHYEYAVFVQELRYLSELLRLEVADILENALGDYDIELFVIKPNRLFKEV